MPKKQNLTENKKFEKEIRTIAWFKYLLKKTSSKNPTQFKKLMRDLNGEFGEGKRQWHNYAKGLSCPCDDTIENIDKLFSGTLSVFKNGPEESNLFNAMFCNDVQTLFMKIVFTRPSPFKGLSTNAHNYFIDKDLDIVLSFMEQVILENHSNNNKLPSYPFYSKQLIFQYLANLTLLLRYYLIRDKLMSSNEEVEHLISILINYLKVKEIKVVLDSYGIRKIYSQWLYLLLTYWCENNYLGYKIASSTQVPSEDDFIENPTLFIKFLISGHIRNSFIFAETTDEIVNYLKNTKKNSKKWLLLNKNYSIKDLKSSLPDSHSSDEYIALASAWICAQ